jgi:hypothetical protein
MQHKNVYAKTHFLLHLRGIGDRFPGLDPHIAAQHNTRWLMG